MSNKAIVVGNGESRKDIDLLQFQQTYTVIGCNALHRDFEPAHLICVDKKMAYEALHNTSIKNTKIYTRRRWAGSELFAVPNLPYVGTSRPDQPDHWGSGPYALLLACNLGFKQITLIGFDLYGNNNQVNNIYKNSVNYRGHLAPAVDCSYWIYQLAKIFEYFPEIKFTIINVDNWKMPSEWQKNNVSFLAL